MGGRHATDDAMFDLAGERKPRRSKLNDEAKVQGGAIQRGEGGPFQSRGLAWRFKPRVRLRSVFSVTVRNHALGFSPAPSCSALAIMAASVSSALRRALPSLPPRSLRSHWGARSTVRSMIAFKWSSMAVAYERQCALAQ